MKFGVSVLLVVVALMARPASAIDFWHSNTVWTGQGGCSAVFTFDSGGEEIANLQVSVLAIDGSDKQVLSNVLRINSFGQSSADRYADAFLEGEAVCSDGLTIVVNKATAVVEGKQVDLLKKKMLSFRDFKPFKIRIGK
jgi:hypothetical protein